jgi:hypothetical protein
MGLKKITEQGSIIMFILSAAWMASTGADQGRGLPSILPLARTGLMDFIRLLDHLWQRKVILSRLVVATQQVGRKDDIRAVQQGRLDLQKVVVTTYAKSCYDSLYFKYLFSSKRDIEPTTESTVAVQPKRID